ncbi:MAG TPA: 3-hydroxy-3-methylglutaryl CoA synthase, partial [Acidobacteriota bacterium]|nr:3-hydroxy-3-methylglutaryl CoA synthase [Acidobacteriota bacterium]
MAGITSIGAYVPRYRLSLADIAAFWRAKGPVGEKAVAGFDEDSLTMAVAAGRDCLGRNGGEADALYFATTTAPYREKQSAAVMAG